MAEIELPFRPGFQSVSENVHNSTQEREKSLKKNSESGLHRKAATIWLGKRIPVTLQQLVNQHSRMAA